MPRGIYDHASRPIAERLWAKVSRGAPDACWPWLGSRNLKGYGSMRGQRGTEQAHRVAYEVGVGTIPTGLQVLHSCDNPSCCNPAHLFIGTNGDNHADKLRKGRQSRGERTGTARLTAEAVRHIRSRFGRDSDGTIARSYSVTPETIRKVRLGLNWRHVK